MNNEERITQGMSAMTIIQALSKSKPETSSPNPEAMLIVMDLLRESKKIDPDSRALSGFGALYNLDSCGIYGSRIEQLHKSVCGGDLTRTVACLRATQLRLIEIDDLNQAIDKKTQLNVENILAMVKEKLPLFALSYNVLKLQDNNVGKIADNGSSRKKVQGL